MPKLQCQQDLDASLGRLAERDPRLARYIATCSPVDLRQRPAGLAGLLQIILAQQVSVASARAIWQKFETRFPGCDVDRLAAASEADLRACSLSSPKIKAVLRITQAIHEGFDLDGLALCEASEIKKALVALHGVGPWTADIYLLFCLGERDVFPSGDLALQIAVQQALAMVSRPSDKVLAAMAQELWAPERGAAAHLFWAIYRDIKSWREGVL